jgi:hypothetical protein
MSFFTDAQRAQMAFQNATQQAQQTTRDIFNQFGMTRVDSSGQWNTGTAAAAFDPTKVVNFTGGNASINQDTLSGLASGQFGTAFGYNTLQKTMGEAAGAEAGIMQNVRSRGLGGGGLARQMQSAAESAQGRAQADVGKQMLAALGQNYGTVGQSYNDYQSALASTAGAGAMGTAGVQAQSPVTAPAAVTAPANQGGGSSNVAIGKVGSPVNAPANPKNQQRYTGPGGFKWQFIGGKGWVRTA